MKEELVAVIVPVYNAEQYLISCVQSIINQTYKNLEIILVDDGSIDGSYRICKKFSECDNRIRALQKENGGPLSAKKIGLESTSAEYIMFVDADDWIEPEMCERLYTIIKEERVDLVTSGIIRFFSEDKCIYESDKMQEGRYSGDNYKKIIIPHMLCNGIFPSRGIDASLAIKLFKRDMLYPIVKAADEQYGHLFAEDTAVLYPYILKAESIYILKDHFYYHRQYENNQGKYFENPNFEHNVQELYSYLETVFEKNESKIILMKQLDYFVCGLFMNKYELHAKKIVKEMPKLQQYLFPFNRVKPDSRVLLYGAGAVGQSFYAQLVKTNYCKEIIWQDQQYEKYQGEQLPVSHVDVKVGADVCVIAIQDENIAHKIRRQLVVQGMEEEKIVWENPLLNMW